MITYREAIADDAPQLLSLLAEIMEHHGVNPPDSAQLMCVLEDIFASPQHIVLVAEKDEEIAGMCALIFTLSTWSGSWVCELQDVVVTKGHRRTHLGRGLLRAAEALARQRGCTRLFLSAEAWNFDAHAFYRSLGLNEKASLYFERDLRERSS